MKAKLQDNATYLTECTLIAQEEFQTARKQTKAMLDAVGIVLTQEETERIEVADFGLNDLQQFGLQLLTYINTERVCAKELVLFPHQTCPEHLHPTIGERAGKEETFRCRSGEVFLYVPAPDGSADSISAAGPNEDSRFTVHHEIRLLPGEQYTIYPDTKHWFRAGENGAVVSEFSTRSTDEADIFTDPRVVRAPAVATD